jgi:hypothetical protein
MFVVFNFSLYFAKIGLGTPSRDFHVQVDTGSDILWVNCAGCIRCPRKSDLVYTINSIPPKKKKQNSKLHYVFSFIVSLSFR